jgi:hypothetical protein
MGRSYYVKLKDLKPSEADYFYKFEGNWDAAEVNKFRALND